MSAIKTLMTESNGWPPFPSLSGSKKPMKVCKICGMEKDANPSHSDTYDGPGKHAFTPVKDSAAKSTDENTLLLTEESPISFGGSVKAIGIQEIDKDGVKSRIGIIEGSAVIHSTDIDPDTSRDFFNSDTDYFFETDNKKAIRPVFYDHGLDKTLKSTKLGKTELEIKPDEVWFQAQLDLSKKYNRYIYKLAEMGELGASTGSAPHLVQRKKVGKSYHIKAWPIVELSLTPKPIEPRTKGTQVVAMKSYAAIERVDLFAKGVVQEELEEDRPHEFEPSTTDPGVCEICDNPKGDPIHAMPEGSGRLISRTDLQSKSMKAIFEQALAERTQSIYDLQDTYREVCREIVNAAEAENITGVKVDVQAKVTEAANEYQARLIPLTVTQINQYLDNKGQGLDNCCGDGFYLRSLLIESPLQTFLRVKSGLESELKLDEHSEKVVSAIEELSRMNTDIIPAVKSWVDRVEEKIDFRIGDETKSGRTISKATRSKLVETVELLKQALAAGEEIHGKLGQLIEVAEPKKSVSLSDRLQIMATIAEAEHLNHIQGIGTSV